MENEQAKRIRSRCYWQAIIRPETFEVTKIEDPSLLFPIVEDSVVTLRRWPFPILSGERNARRDGEDWVGEEVGEEIGWKFGPSLWRLYQSGQFISLLAMWRDWYGRSPATPEGAGAQDSLPFWDTIRQFTEIYEFAARLSLTEAGDAAMRVNVKIGNIAGRILGQDDPGRTPFRYHRYQERDFSWPGPRSEPISRDALVADPREFAAEGLADLFKRFDFNAGTKVIRAWQEELDKP
jgi:hypothetical protein